MKTLQWIGLVLIIGISGSLKGQDTSRIEEGQFPVFGFDPKVISCPVIHVDIDAPGPVHDGESWQTAFTSLQDALDASDYGDFIWVAAGVYRPDNGKNVTSGDIEATFLLRNGVVIQGGFAGYGTADPYLRDIECFETVLSGDLACDDEQRRDLDRLLLNSLHVVTAIGADENTLVDGVTITGGNASYRRMGPTNGGAILLVDSSLTIQNCTFMQSLAYEGALLSSDGGSPSILECLFLNDEDMVCRSGVHVASGAPYFALCTFTMERGNGMRVEKDTGLMVDRCAFLGNNGSGILAYGANAAVVSSCFKNNGHPGITYVGLDSTLHVQYCTFEANAHGIYHLGGTLLAEGSCFLWNRPNSGGSGIHMGRGYASISDSVFLGNRTGMFTVTNPQSAPCEAMMTNCLLAQNVRSLVASARSLTLINCTLAPSRWHNHADKVAVEVGAMKTLRLLNCIVWEKSCDWLWCQETSTIDIQNSCLVSGVGLTGDNIIADPLFARLPSDGGDGWGDNPWTPQDEGANDDWGDLRLLPGSPCVDAGDSTHLPEDLTTDLGGNSRIRGRQVDMGAYESH